MSFTQKPKSELGTTAQISAGLKTEIKVDAKQTATQSPAPTSAPDDKEKAFLEGIKKNEPGYKKVTDLILAILADKKTESEYKCKSMWKAWGKTTTPGTIQKIINTLSKPDPKKSYRDKLAEVHHAIVKKDNEFRITSPNAKREKLRDILFEAIIMPNNSDDPNRPESPRHPSDIYHKLIVRLEKEFPDALKGINKNEFDPSRLPKTEPQNSSPSVSQEPQASPKSMRGP